MEIAELLFARRSTVTAESPLAMDSGLTIASAGSKTKLKIFIALIDTQMLLIDESCSPVHLRCVARLQSIHQSLYEI